MEEAANFAGPAGPIHTEGPQRTEMEFEQAAGEGSSNSGPSRAVNTVAAAGGAQVSDKRMSKRPMAEFLGGAPDDRDLERRPKRPRKEDLNWRIPAPARLAEFWHNQPPLQAQNWQRNNKPVSFLKGEHATSWDGAVGEQSVYWDETQPPLRRSTTPGPYPVFNVSRRTLGYVLQLEDHGVCKAEMVKVTATARNKKSELRRAMLSATQDWRAQLQEQYRHGKAEGLAAGLKDAGTTGAAYKEKEISQYERQRRAFMAGANATHLAAMDAGVRLALSGDTAGLEEMSVAVGWERARLEAAGVVAEDEGSFGYEIASSSRLPGDEKGVMDFCGVKEMAAPRGRPDFRKLEAHNVAEMQTMYMDGFDAGMVSFQAEDSEMADVVPDVRWNLPHQMWSQEELSSYFGGQLDEKLAGGAQPRGNDEWREEPKGEPMEEDEEVERRRAQEDAGWNLATKLQAEELAEYEATQKAIQEAMGEKSGW